MTIYINGTSGISGVDGSAGTPAIQGTDANTGISFPAADTVAINTGGSERVRTDSSGRLLVGTSTSLLSYASLQIQGGATDSGGHICLANTSAAPAGNVNLGSIRFTNNAGGIGALIGAETDGAWTAGTNFRSRLVFSVTQDGSASPTERLRLINNGIFYHYSSLDGIVTSTSGAAGTSVYAFVVRHSASAVNTGTDSLYIFNNGDVRNTNNSYGAISDIKLKENIQDAASQWSDIKSLQVRKYNFKEETGQQTHTQIGLVAQEVELVSPGLVSEFPDRDEDGNDLGTVTKSVNYSVLYMKAVKALQEAMERIETLEAKVAALEAA